MSEYVVRQALTDPRRIFMLFKMPSEVGIIGTEFRFPTAEDDYFYLPTIKERATKIGTVIHDETGHKPVYIFKGETLTSMLDGDIVDNMLKILNILKGEKKLNWRDFEVYLCDNYYPVMIITHFVDEILGAVIAPRVEEYRDIFRVPVEVPEGE